MHLLIDLFGCDEARLDAFTAPDNFRVAHLGKRAWLDGMSFEDFDANALVRGVRDELDADFAEYQVIDRPGNVREPRGAAPWFTVGRPGVETEPGELVPASPQEVPPERKGAAGSWVEPVVEDEKAVEDGE